MLYQTHERETYARNIALELLKSKPRNVIVQKSQFRKEYDARYSRTNRFLLMENYMNKRNADYLIDLHDAYVPTGRLFSKPIMVGNEKYDLRENWETRNEFAEISCHPYKVKAVQEYFKSYHKPIKVKATFPRHQNYFIVEFMPHKPKSESLEFLKYFIGLVQSGI